MFQTLRFKLLLGFVPPLAITVALGLWAIVMLYRLGGNIDVILRENYRSVLAVERMKEALERIDSSLVFAMSGRLELARRQFDKFKPEFLNNLRLEQGNVTLPGEGEKVDRLTAESASYLELAGASFTRKFASSEARADFYFNELLPRFQRIGQLEDQILLTNQRNMEDMDLRARSNASSSIRLMIGALLVATVLSIASARVLTRFILEPIRAVTEGARELARGQLDQVVPTLTRDELGELGQAFNAMARTIREYREAGTARLVRAQMTAQATIDSFPDPVVVVDLSGVVERANPAAQRILQARPGLAGGDPWAGPATLKPHLDLVLAGHGNYLPIGLDQAVFLRDGNTDRFFLPRIMAIRGSSGEMVGAAVVLSDVTKFHLVDQLKSNMISTVSHELKTPLTSLQMAVHLLLEEAVGPLTPKQIELLIAARQDADRLLAMINDLLDLARIEQGNLVINQQCIDAAVLLREAHDRFRSQADDSGLALTCNSVPNLMPVSVDKERIEHVFDNLLANAIKHTPRGGRVDLRAEERQGLVQISVQDTGEGIAPEHQARVFERFFRTPDSRQSEGAGLGLAIAREIVEAHGGEISVDSRKGQGTSFTFTLPVASPRTHEMSPEPGGANIT